jgi:CheY-like chemotaxis protein/HPt (histidine-containing phosphotransfer) domain-containing protein
MTVIHVLHVDDEPDIREVAELSLGLDPGLSTRSCGSGEEALKVAAEWLPDIILMDVMMPVMDGPATLSRLRDNPVTANIPVIFMTARAQTRELDRFRALGAVGVIPKPFDPMTLAAAVRQYVQPAAHPLDTLRAGFLLRVKKDVGTLQTLRTALRDGSDVANTLASIRQVAHGLAGAGGIYGFIEISDAAAALEDAVINQQETPGLGAAVADALDNLIQRGESKDTPPPHSSPPLQPLQQAAAALRTPTLESLAPH